MPKRLTAPNLDRYVVAETGCWLWTGWKLPGGYGTLWDPIRKSQQRAHRLMYEREVGQIPDGHELDHLCENPPCINPAHLEPVTRLEHNRRTQQRRGKDHLHLAAVEMWQKGHTAREIAAALGWSSPVSASAALRYAIDKGLVSADAVERRNTMTEEVREQMRDLYGAGYKQTWIAEWYGLHSSQVSRIVRGLNSGHGKPDKRAERIAASPRPAP